MAEELKIVQVAGSAAGGVRGHVRELAAGLALGDRVILAAPGETARPWIRGLRSTIVDITDRPRPQDSAVVAKLRTMSRRADVVHAHGLRAGALAALALTGLSTPLVVTLHNLPVGGPAVQAVAGGLERLVARRAAVVLVVSGDIGERMSAIGASRVERALVPAQPRTPGQLDRDGLGVTAQQLVVTLARLAPQKGLDLLMETAGLLADRVPDAVWLVAGDGPRREELQQIIDDEALPVRLLGRRGDAPDLLAAADVVVSTAQWEGQPLWLQEALAAGAPIVATDVGGTSEVTHDAARLVPYGDADRLCTQIVAVLRQAKLADSLRAASLARAAQLPDADAALAQVRSIYRTVLA
ncbi:MAG: glycosyltransferase family 4 protein [Beutenbergiaceae bacterium]